MKKIFAFLLLGLTVAFASCGDEKTDWPGAVARGPAEIRVLFGLAGAAEHLPLPPGMRGAGPAVGRGLHQVAVHFVGQGILKPEGRLINASYHIHPHCRLHGHGAAGSVVHGRQPLAGQLLNGVPYGGIGVESAGAHLEPKNDFQYRSPFPFKVPFPEIVNPSSPSAFTKAIK